MKLVLDAVDLSSCESLHVSSNNNKGNKSKLMPGFDSVRPAKDKAAFWHSIWVSCNKPINTELHQIMKRTRSIYHYQIRKIKAARNKIKASKLLESSLNGGTDLFKEIRKMRKSKNVVANQIDGETEDISNHFADIYKDLFKSVDDQENLKSIKETIDNGIDNKSILHVDKVTPEVIKEAVMHLNNEKSDPTFSFSSDCFKNAPDQLFLHLSNIFRCFLIHGHVSGLYYYLPWCL